MTLRDECGGMPLFLRQVSSLLARLDRRLGGCGFADKAVMRASGAAARGALYLGRSIGLIVNARERGRLALPSARN